ncbi:MAG: hypothetical protein ACK5MK_03420 [Dysgonomonas sp.]
MLHEARLGICCILENRTDTSISLQALQSLVMRNIEPVKANGKLLYLESLRTIMQATLQVLYRNIDMSELQTIITEWCMAHCNKFKPNMTDFITLENIDLICSPFAPLDLH